MKLIRAEGSLRDKAQIDIFFFFFNNCPSMPKGMINIRVFRVHFQLSNGSSPSEIEVLPVDLPFHHLSPFIAIYQTFERVRYAVDKKGLDVDKSSGIIVTYGHSVPSHYRYGGSLIRVAKSELPSC